MRYRYCAFIAAALILIGCDPCVPTPCEDCNCVNDTVYSQCREKELFYRNLLSLMGYFDRTCQSSESTWKTVSAVNTSVMPLDFYVTPKNNNMDGVIGLSNGNASGYADVAVSVRFNADGFIDIRDGDVYRADTPIAYHACDKFRIQLNVDMQNHTFSAAVDTGDMLASLASVAKFRTQQQNVAQLDRLVHFSETGTQEVCYEAKLGEI